MLRPIRRESRRPARRAEYGQSSDGCGPLVAQTSQKWLAQRWGFSRPSAREAAWLLAIVDVGSRALRRRYQRDKLGVTGSIPVPPTSEGPQLQGFLLPAWRCEKPRVQFVSGWRHGLDLGF